MVPPIIRLVIITDHANSEPHKVAMVEYRKDQAKKRNEPITSYSTIARSLMSSPMDQSVREQVKRKFDISFVIAKEHLPFSKYPAIHDLEAKHELTLERHIKIMTLLVILFTIILRAKGKASNIHWNRVIFSES